MAVDPTITAAWQRWAHRSDLVADLAMIENLARERIRNRLMQIADVSDIDALQTSNPSIWLYAGLLDIFDLVQDTEQMQSATELFENGISNYIMQLSIDQGTPAAVKTDYQ